MINLSLELAHVQVIMAGLAKLSIEQGMATWQAVSQQAQPQADALAAQQQQAQAAAPADATQAA